MQLPLKGVCSSYRGCTKLPLKLITGFVHSLSERGLQRAAHNAFKGKL